MRIRQKKRPFLLLILSFLVFAGLLYLILNFDPTRKFSVLSSRFSVLPAFFPLLFLCIFSLTAYILNNSRRGLFAALFVTSYLLLRFFHLTHLFFLLLLIALFFTLELLFLNRKWNDYCKFEAIGSFETSSHNNRYRPAEPLSIPKTGWSDGPTDRLRPISWENIPIILWKKFEWLSTL